MTKHEEAYHLVVRELQSWKFETGGKVWADGWGVVAAGHKSNKETSAIVIVATAETMQMTPASRLIVALREARLGVVMTSKPMPVDAARWLTTIIEQYEKDHPADRPN